MERNKGYETTGVDDEMVVVNFETESKHGKDEDGDDSKQDNGAVPLMEYRLGHCGDSRRMFKMLWLQKPRLLTFLFTLLCCGLPFMIATGMLARFRSPADSSTSSANISPWSQYYTSSDSAAVAADVGQCSQLGVEIMKEGGNAVDAAVTVALCLGVLNPASSGVGGGCFILIHNASTMDDVFIDSRETAPSRATNNMFAANPMLSQDGGLAIAVLGELRGLYQAWRYHGSGNLDWSDLVKPAAALATKFKVSPELGHLIPQVKAQLYSGHYPGLAAMLLNPDGSMKVAGDFIERPQFADTLLQVS